MQPNIQKSLDTCNRDTFAAGEIIVLGPTWRNIHPLTVRLLCDLKSWGWLLTRDSHGRYYAMCAATYTEGQA